MSVNRQTPCREMDDFGKGISNSFERSTDFLINIPYVSSTNGYNSPSLVYDLKERHEDFE